MPKSKEAIKKKCGRWSIKLVVIKCKECKKQFSIDWDYIGIVTCPYCGEYVEG